MLFSRHQLLDKTVFVVFSYTFDLTEELARAFAHSSSFNLHPLPLCDCFEPSEFRNYWKLACIPAGLIVTQDPDRQIIQLNFNNRVKNPNWPTALTTGPRCLLLPAAFL